MKMMAKLATDHILKDEAITGGQPQARVDSCPLCVPSAL